MARIHIEIFAGRSGGHYWRVVGANGEKMSASQAYTRRSSAKRAARRLHPALPIEVV